MVTGNMCGVYGCTDKSEGVAKVIYERGEEIVPHVKNIWIRYIIQEIDRFIFRH